MLTEMKKPNYLQPHREMSTLTFPTVRRPPSAVPKNSQKPASTREQRTPAGPHALRTTPWDAGMGAPLP